jgi:hypothetical protein
MNIDNSTDEAKHKKEETIPIDKSAKIQYDGKQFLVRIPKEISEFYGINKEKKLKFRFIVEPIVEGKGKNFFEIIPDDKRKQ